MANPFDEDPFTPAQNQQKQQPDHSQQYNQEFLNQQDTQQNKPGFSFSRQSQGQQQNPSVGGLFNNTLNFGKNIGTTTFKNAANLGKTTFSTASDFGKFGLQQTSKVATGTLDLGKQLTGQGYGFWESSRKQVQTTVRKLGHGSFGESLEQQTQQELQYRPVPRIVLSCCQILGFQHNLETPHLFTGEVAFNQIEYLFVQFSQAHGACLYPTAVNPQGIASFLKFYLSVLPEPLLTYRLIPEFVGSVQNFSKARAMQKQLPLANRVSLDLVLNLCNRIVQVQHLNQVDSTELAAALVPSLAWYPLPSKQDMQHLASQNQTAKNNMASANELRGLPLEPSDQKALEIVLEHLITTYEKDNIE